MQAASLSQVTAGLGRISWIAEGLRRQAADALADAERARDVRGIMEASLALGQIDTIRATLKESGAPPPQRRPRQRVHTVSTVPQGPGPVKLDNDQP